jgi:hypothetical protein
LQYFEKKRPVVLPLEALGTRAALTYRSTAKGLVHDLMTKFYWHEVREAFPPARIFETILCPGDFMEKALHRSGITNTRVVFNPSSVPVALQPSSAPGKRLSSAASWFFSVDCDRKNCFRTCGALPTRSSCHR